MCIRDRVYGLLSTLANQRVFEFDDEIALDYGENQVMAEHTYQRKLPLRPGRFKLELLVKDTISGNMGTVAIGIEIPSGTQGRLATSSIMLARGIEPTAQDLAQAYVFGSYKIRPQVDRAFAFGDDLAFYFEAYNFQVDQAAEKPALDIKYGFADPGKLPTTYRPVTRGITLAGDRIYVARIVQLNNVPKGKHDLVLSITDTLSGQTAIARAPFEIR